MASDPLDPLAHLPDANQKVWHQVPELTPEAVGYLWFDKEPQGEGVPLPPAVAEIVRMLERRYPDLLTVLNAYPKFAVHVTKPARHRLTREQLRAIAEEFGMRPKFLYPEDRQPTQPEPNQAERVGWAKLIFGMAKAGYGFDPQAERNKATADIAADLALAECPMDDATVLKYLRQAAKSLDK